MIIVTTLLSLLIHENGMPFYLIRTSFVNSAKFYECCPPFTRQFINGKFLYYS